MDPLTQTLDILRAAGFPMENIDLRTVTYWAMQQQKTPEWIAKEIYGVKAAVK